MRRRNSDKKTRQELHSWQRQHHAVRASLFYDEQHLHTIITKKPLQKVKCIKTIECHCKNHRLRFFKAHNQYMSKAPPIVLKKRSQDNATMNRWTKELYGVLP